MMFRRMVAALALLVFVAGAAGAQYPDDCHNVIGIYTTEDPLGPAAADSTVYDGAPGTFTAYVVVTNPYNPALDSPIANLGGYELRLDLPADVYLLGSTLPGGAVLSSTPPDFRVAMDIPVIDARATLLTLDLGAYTGTPGEIGLAPLQDTAPTIAGSLMVADADDGDSPAAAQPSTGDLAAPVFTVFTGAPAALVPCLATAADLVPDLPATVGMTAPVGHAVDLTIHVTNQGADGDTLAFTVDDTLAGFTLDDAFLAVTAADSTVLHFTPTALGATSTQLHATQRGTGVVRTYTLQGDAYLAGLYVAPAPAGDDSLGDGSRDLPWATIQHAIDQAVTGDVVILMDGTYTGDRNRDLDFQGKGIVLRSESGVAADVVVDCEGTETERHLALYLHNDEPIGTAVEGITFRRAYGPADKPAAVYVGQSVDPDSVVSLEFTGCVVDSSTGAGLYLRGYYNQLVLTDCLFRDNSTNGVYVFAASSGSSITNCRFEGNDQNGLYLFDPAGLVVGGCEFVSNGSAGCVYAVDDYGSLSGSLFMGNGTGFVGYANLIDCEIQGNSGAGVSFFGGPYGPRGIDNCDIFDNGGDGVYADYAKSAASDPAAKYAASLGDSRIHDNGGDGVNVYGFSGPLTNLVIYGNQGTGLRAGGEDAGVNVSDCTIAGNGDGIYLGVWGAKQVNTMTNTLVANNTGCGLSGNFVNTYGDTVWTFTNCDVSGNTGGDSCVPGLTIPAPGIMSKDPLFCDAPNDDYALAANSPCAPSVLHARIGALDAACAGVDAPVLLSVQDIPEDQGGQVRLTWYRSGQDEAGSTDPVIGYDVYRRDTPGTAAKLLGWDYLMRVPARGDQGYQVVAPTLWDATAADGPRPTVFMISAVTADPLTFFDSTPDSGWSVDNLAPGTPDSLKVAYTAAENVVRWTAPADPDVEKYQIWRTDGTPPGADPGPPTADGVTAAEWHDTGFTGSAWNQVYWVAAVDHAGNRGPLTNWSGAAVSAVGDAGLPTVLALRGNVPNPFNPLTHVRFDLPHPARVQLDIYDVAGRRVRRLVAGEAYPAGRHEAVWNGRDDAGQSVAAGVYISRLQADGEQMTGRMLLMK